MMRTMSLLSNVAPGIGRLVPLIGGAAIIAALAYFAWSHDRADRAERAAIAREARKDGQTEARLEAAETLLEQQQRVDAAVRAQTEAEAALKAEQETNLAEIRAEARRLARPAGQCLGPQLVGLRNQARDARNAARPALRDGPSVALPSAAPGDL